MLCKILIALAFLSSNLLAESSVWKISSDKHTLYLGGTCHVLRPSDYPLPKEFDEAFENSDLLVLETDMVAMANPELQMHLLMKGQLPDNKTLEDLLSAESYAAITAWAKKLGFPLFSINRLKPTLVIVSLLSLEFQRLGISSAGVDQYYSDRAVAEDKKMDHFETPEEQIDFILNMVPGKEDELVSQTLEDLDRMQEQLEQLIDAWKIGDLKHIEKYMIREMRRDYPEIYESLLVQRNINWLPKIFRMLKSPETECILVGAAHLVGDDGLLFLLNQSGYRVEQFESAPKLKLRMN